MISKKELNRLFKDISYCRKEEFIETMAELANYISEVEQARADAAQKVKDFNKDEEIVKLKAKLEEKQKRAKNLITFSIESEYVEKIKEWKKRHEKEKHNGSDYAGAIGGRYTYEFTPTSIGTFGRIRCSCGDHFDFDDGSDW